MELPVEPGPAEQGRVARAEIQVRREARLLQQAAQEATPEPTAAPVVGAGQEQQPVREVCPVVLEAAQRVGWAVQGPGR